MNDYLRIIYRAEIVNKKNGKPIVYGYDGEGNPIECNFTYSCLDDCFDVWQNDPDYNTRRDIKLRIYLQRYQPNFDGKLKEIKIYETDYHLNLTDYELESNE